MFCVFVDAIFYTNFLIISLIIKCSQGMHPLSILRYFWQ